MALEPLTSWTPVDLESAGVLDFMAAQAVEGFLTGLHASPHHGFSVEFAEHRLYNTGESTRHLDWKLLARTDKYFSKRYEEETNLRAHLLVDASASMFYPETGNSKWEFALRTAAALTHVFRRQRDAYGLMLCDDQLHRLVRPGLGQSHHHTVMLHLQKALRAKADQYSKGTALVESLNELAETMPPRSLLLVFSDCFEPGMDAQALVAALQHLRYNRHEVLLFQVLDHQTEVRFDWPQGPYRLIDPETGNELKLNPSEYREAYVQAYQDFASEMRLRCGQLQIEWIEVDCQKGLADVLQGYLRQRSKRFR
jgi:uncharacterized protein (DUF58 family)